jgi:hypothetical protein
MPAQVRKIRGIDPLAPNIGLNPKAIGDPGSDATHGTEADTMDE